MAQRGVDAWILSLRDTHANPSPVQEHAKELKTLDTSGLRSSESSENVGQLSLFSKMSKDISPRDFVKSSKISWNWGSMLSGEFIPQPKPDLLSAETECSSWPTAVAGDSRSSGRHSTKTGVMHPGTTLTDSMRQWRTPAERDHKGVTQDKEAKAWPTPGANDHKGSFQLDQRQGQLDEAAEQRFQTPPSHQVPKETGQMSQRTSGLRLNPLFVEWLMGFPCGWISLEPSAMPLSPNKQPSHSEISGQGSGNASS